MSLMMIIIYIFANIATQKYQGKFYDENRMFPTTKTGPFDFKPICEEIGDCTWNLLNYGLRYGGGIGDIMMNIGEENNNDKTWILWKQFYDVCFYMLINVISLNMVFGIIIDAFSELREINDAKGKVFGV